jgi:hypothetical protein|nr:MAG TPA: hypothetical protein [Caudoviricetes sp.]
MQNPELYLKEVRTDDEEKLFLDLIDPYFDEDDIISAYRLKCVVQSKENKAYAVYEVNHNIIACRFYLDDELLLLGNDETVQFMSMDEVRFVRELGEIAIDGLVYSIRSTVFHVIDKPGGCQNMIVFNLENK